MLAYAVTLSDIEAGNVRIPGQPKPKKQSKAEETATKIEISEETEQTEQTEEGEEQC